VIFLLPQLGGRRFGKCLNLHDLVVLQL
jgi:hypothetical protein